MELLEKINKEIEILEYDRNIEMFEAWQDNEAMKDGYKEAEKVRKKYASKIRFLENMKAMQETVIADYDYYMENKK